MAAGRVLSLLISLLCALALLVGCDGTMGPAPDGGDGDGDSDGDSDADADVDTEGVPADPTEFTYLLEESPPGLPIWTMPATRRPVTSDRPPEDQRSGLFISAARREFEPAQLLLGPGSGTVTVEVSPFADLGSGGRLDLAHVLYDEGWAEHPVHLPSGGSVPLSGSEATPVWLTVRVPDDAPAGEHHTTLTLTPSSGSAVTVPVTLRVFDFSIPEEIHYATQINVSIEQLMGGVASVDDAKSLLFDLRMTPKSVTWPSGFNWGITWEGGADSSRCDPPLWDEPDEGAAYSISALSRRYILGEGWNGIGFPNAMIFQFVDNGTPRPGSFCGVDRGDHYGTSAYNAEWSEFLGAVDSYLHDNGMGGRAYYYVQNEPQNDEDHRLAAHLCRLTRAAAPGLRIAISEEPKPEIAEHPDGGCGYDIWIAHIRAYEQGYAWQRQQEHGEEVWLYSLDHDPDPYFNPTRLDRQGVHMRIIPWVSWRLRATGWAYYDGGRFFNGALPTVRARLLREGFEDYEYLYLANGGAHPRPNRDEAADPAVLSVASSLTSWSHDPDALMTLRFELGRYIEGSRDTMPVLEAEEGIRPRGEYHLNFQDPGGQPGADPLSWEGMTYMKIGWAPYDETLGYGWSGEHIDDPSIAQYGWVDASGYSEVERSFVYDDYGRRNLFEFALANGRYDVTVGAGWPDRAYAGDPHTVIVEGVAIIDDEPTSADQSVFRRTATIDLIDGSLSIEMGGRSPSTGEFAYTFLQYVDVVPTE